MAGFSFPPIPAFRKIKRFCIVYVLCMPAFAAVLIAIRFTAILFFSIAFIENPSFCIHIFYFSSPLFVLELPVPQSARLCYGMFIQVAWSGCAVDYQPIPLSAKDSESSLSDKSNLLDAVSESRPISMQYLLHPLLFVQSPVFLLPLLSLKSIYHSLKALSIFFCLL